MKGDMMGMLKDAERTRSMKGRVDGEKYLEVRCLKNET